MTRFRTHHTTIVEVIFQAPCTAREKVNRAKNGEKKRLEKSRKVIKE